MQYRKGINRSLIRHNIHTVLFNTTNDNVYKQGMHITGFRKEIQVGSKLQNYGHLNQTRYRD